MTSTENVWVFSNTAEENLGLHKMCKAWEDSGFWSEDSVRQALSTHGTSVTFIPQENSPAAWSAGCLFRCTGQVADLLYIFVLPGYRRQGLADLLLDDMVRRLRQQGCDRLLLEVRPGNHAAIDLYKSFGMRQIAFRQRYYQNGDDALIYQLDLN